MYIFNSSIFWYGVLFKDKNSFYTISANVSSFGLCIKDILQLNMHLLADWPESILFKNNKITILQKGYDGQDQQGILIILLEKKMIALISSLERNGGMKMLRDNSKRRLSVWNTCRRWSWPGWTFKSPIVFGVMLQTLLRSLQVKVMGMGWR